MAPDKSATLAVASDAAPLLGIVQAGHNTAPCPPQTGLSRPGPRLSSVPPVSTSLRLDAAACVGQVRAATCSGHLWMQRRSV